MFKVGDKVFLHTPPHSWVKVGIYTVKGFVNLGSLPCLEVEEESHPISLARFAPLTELTRAVFLCSE